jgi:hypothetical protein
MEARMPETEPTERRAEQRRRTLKAATIQINRNSVISCMVRNASAHGSRLSVDSILGVPEEFVLDVFGEPPRKARVVWKTFTEVGIELA